MTDEGTLSWIVKLHFKFLQPKSAMSTTQKNFEGKDEKKKNECTFLIDFLLRVKVRHASRSLLACSTSHTVSF